MINKIICYFYGHKMGEVYFPMKPFCEVCGKGLK